MAKSHIQHLARVLAHMYEQVEDMLTEASLALGETALSPDEQAEFSKYKADIDNNLSLLSVSLSAAAQGKISKFLCQVEAERVSIADPLKRAIDDLSNPAITPELIASTQNLIKMYNARLRNINSTLGVIKAVKVFADCPNRKKKQHKYLLPYLGNYFDSIESERLKTFTIPLACKLGYMYNHNSPFTELDDSIANFKQYLAQFGSENLIPGPIDDLSE